MKLNDRLKNEENSDYERIEIFWNGEQFSTIQGRFKNLLINGIGNCEVVDEKTYSNLSAFNEVLRLYVEGELEELFDEAPKQKKTNFEAITESPERLAEFKDDKSICKYCIYSEQECSYILTACNKRSKENRPQCQLGILRWLKKEVEEE